MASDTRSSLLWEPPLWFGFAWGVAEATLFFIIPDVLVSWAALVGFRPGIKTLGEVIAGSLLGGGLMYGWASLAPEQAALAVSYVPFVREQMFAEVHQQYQDFGMAGLFVGPSSGIPYKIYAVLAPPLHQPFLFLLFTIPARLERIFSTWVLFATFGWFLRAHINRQPRFALFLFASFWTVVYITYWSRVIQS